MRWLADAARYLRHLRQVFTETGSVHPQAIRACLAPSLAAEFDSEWEIALERAQQSKDLAGAHDLLSKWRHTAYLEMRDPGSYYRMLAKAEQIMRTGRNPDAASFEGMQALIRQRLSR